MNSFYPLLCTHKLDITFLFFNRTDGPAEQVFADLPVKTPEAYCSLIKGFCKVRISPGFTKQHKETVLLGDLLYLSLVELMQIFYRKIYIFFVVSFSGLIQAFYIPRFLQINFFFF